MMDTQAPGDAARVASVTARAKAQNAHLQKLKGERMRLHYKARFCRRPLYVSSPFYLPSDHDPSHPLRRPRR